ncbi:50S ribosomal protein L3, partial [Patescibacteria group bacterium]|nr:50S ribosomal protein L3 [Patescibacteria group bacterium]
ETKIFVGEQIKPTIFFKKGDKVTVSGISKGKGFQGAVKRHHFKGGPRTHGQSHGERAPGSIGMTTTPGRVFRGKRMAGRMGNDRVTVKGLEVVDVIDGGIVVKGLVPGHNGNLLEVRAN